MVKLTRINYIAAGFMFFMVMTGIRVTYSNIQEYGWEYNQTITIGNETTMTTVSASTEVFGMLFLVVLGVILLIDGRALTTGLIYDTSLQEGDDVVGIIFPRGDPEDWDLSMDLRTKTVIVALNDKTISFPLSKLTGWADQYDKKRNAEETK